ncbi:MAG TPA: hypothetical protein GX507_05490 [Clostridia bacterium]|nr:hypothetical protein [Clostridia bacterium]
MNRLRVLFGIILSVSGLIVWVFSCNVSFAEVMEANVSVVEEPKVTLTIEDGCISLGKGNPGDEVSDTISGSVTSSVPWKLTYRASDFSNGLATIPISAVTLSGTELEAPIVLGSRGTIYDGMAPTGDSGFAFRHTFSLLIPEDAQPGEYSASIDYTVTQVP